MLANKQEISCNGRGLPSHEVVATTIGELPDIAQGVEMFGIAVDPIGRMFGVDVLGDQLFAI